MLSTVQVLCWTGARELMFAALLPCGVLSRARSAPRDPATQSPEKVLLGRAALRKPQLLYMKLISTTFSHTLGQEEILWARSLAGVQQESSTAGNGSDGTEPAGDGCLLERLTVQQDSRSPAEQLSPQHGHPQPSLTRHLCAALASSPPKKALSFKAGRRAEVRAAPGGRALGSTAQIAREAERVTL